MINLSADKPQVVREAARVLRLGGRIAISDVIRTRELPERLQTEQALAWEWRAPRSEDLATMLSAAGLSRSSSSSSPRVCRTLPTGSPARAPRSTFSRQHHRGQAWRLREGREGGPSCAKKEAPKVAPQVAAAMACC